MEKESPPQSLAAMILLGGESLPLGVGDKFEVGTKEVKFEKKYEWSNYKRLSKEVVLKDMMFKLLIKVNDKGQVYVYQITRYINYELRFKHWFVTLNKSQLLLIFDWLKLIK